MYIPRKFSEEELKKAGVEMDDAPNRLVLRCVDCGAWWSPNPVDDQGTLAEGYWKCPNKCNCTGL